MINGAHKDFGLGSFREELAPDARAVANLFLSIAPDFGVTLTNLKLQKLLYFAHADSLTVEGRALIRQDFEAWQMGPVVKVIYDQFKNFKDRPIIEPARAFSVDEKAWLPVPFGTIDMALRKIAHRTIETYGRVSAFHLSELSHQAGGPWDSVRNRPSSRANIALRISNELIHAHFSKKETRNPLN